MDILELALKFGLEVLAVVGGIVFYLNKRLDKIDKEQEGTNAHLSLINGRIGVTEVRAIRCEADIKMQLAMRPDFDQTRKICHEIVDHNA